MWAIKIGVSAILLYVLFSRIDTAELWAQVRNASIGWIVTALAVYFLMILVATWRWRVLLRRQHVSMPFGRLLNSYLAATFANNFLPSNIGGDVIRISDTPGREVQDTGHRHRSGRPRRRRARLASSRHRDRRCGAAQRHAGTDVLGRLCSAWWWRRRRTGET
jgi:hypothetical protein